MRFSMIIVDAHCDTASEVLDKGCSLYSNGYHADLKRMLGAGGWVQFFAAFVDPDNYRYRTMQRAVSIIDCIRLQAEANSGAMSICLNHDDIINTVKDNKVAAIISIEGGEALQGELAALRMFHRLGVRSVCLTWNYRNEIGDGVTDTDSGGGLTPFGREVVSEMNRLGMLVDVSHLSEKGFWDVLEFSKAPIIASHSNARALCSHPRNLTDEQIAAITKNGGVIGINLYPCFLKDDGKAGIDDIAAHIEHIVSIAGEDHVGLGCDFDGIECTPDGIAGVQDIGKLFERLLSINYKERFIEKFAGENFLKIIKKVLL
jgi:membrane dipeptidase